MEWEPTFEVGILSGAEPGTRAEVDEFQLPTAHVDDDVLVLDVTVDHPSRGTGDGCLDDLLEEASRRDAGVGIDF